MDKTKVSIAYFTDDELEGKEIELTQIELIGLMLSNKMGSEGKYFSIRDKIFEDTKDGFSITIVLEDENKEKTELPYVGLIQGIKKY